MNFPCLALALIALSSPAFAADVVKLKNGDQVRGEILEQRFNESVQIRTETGEDKTLPWNEISSIVKEAAVVAPAVTAITAAPAPTPVPALANTPAPVESPTPPAAQPAVTPATALAPAPAPAPTPATALAPAPAPTPAPAPAPATATAPSSNPPWPLPGGEHRDPRVWLTFSLGATVSNSSSYDFNQSFSTSIQNDKGDTSPLLGAEVLVKFGRVFGLAGIVEVSRYNYSNSSVDADTQVNLLVMPRIQTTGAMAHFWAGLAAGYAHTQVGLVKSVNNSRTIEVDGFAPGIAISPRMGVDFNLDEKVTLGVSAFYLAGAGKINGQYIPANSIGTSFTETVHRSWIGLEARAGIGF